MALHGWRPDEVSQLVSQAIWESNKRMEERQDRRLTLVLGSLKHLKDELRRQKEVQQEQLLELDLARQEIEKGRARQEEMLQKQKDSAELHSHVFEAVRRADAGLSSLERKILAWEQLHMQPPPISSSQQEVKDSNDEASSDVTAALSSHSDIQEETSWMHSTQQRFAAYDQDLLDLREQLEVVKREHSNLAGGSILLHDRIDILEKVSLGPCHAFGRIIQLIVRDSNDEACSDVAEMAASSSRSDIEEDVRDLRQQLEALREKHLNLARGNIMLHGRVDSLHKNFANHDKLIKFVWEKMPDEDSATEDEDSATEDEVSLSESEDEAQDDDDLYE
eukprot:symbB.v1.2.038357.t1/scaffold5934.1/size24165/2